MQYRSFAVKVIVLVLFMAAAGGPLPAQTAAPFSLIVTPGVALPLGNSRNFYTVGGAVNLTGTYTVPNAPMVYLGGALEYNYLPLATERNLTILSAGVEAGVQYALFPRLSAAAGGGGGVYLGLFDGETGPGGYLSAGMRVAYQVSPGMSLGLGAGYQNFLANPNSLFQGVSFSFLTSFHLGGGARRSRLEIQEVEILPIFPVLYKYYDEQPLGTVTIENGEQGTIHDIKVTFQIRQYMETPKTCAVFTQLRRGERIDVNLYGLFDSRIMEITEATRVTAEIKITYDYLDSEYEKIESPSVRVYDRNAMTWDDDRKAAAFVTAKDPSVLRFSKSVAGVVREAAGSAVNNNFRVALGLFQGLSEHGISYVVDPNTPYAEFSKSGLTLDYLQFPRQTLEFRAGDCDDLAILYNALAESVGIETAFITVPGHIYSAFSPGIDPDSARRIFRQGENFIIQDGKTWIPLETTLIGQGFVRAWHAGAQQWRDHALSGNARLYPVHEAWRLYEPAAFVGPDSGMQFPPDSRLAASYSIGLSRFVEQEIAGEVGNLQSRIQRDGDHRTMNSLGVLYARYGMLQQARVQFENALGREENVPALINLGNIYLLEGDAQAAWGYFERAEVLQPQNPTVLLHMARIKYEQGNYAAAAGYHGRLNEVSMQLAGRHSYLSAARDTRTRASAIDFEALISWEEEE